MVQPFQTYSSFALQSMIAKLDNNYAAAPLYYLLGITTDTACNQKDALLEEIYNKNANEPATLRPEAMRTAFMSLYMREISAVNDHIDRAVAADEVDVLGSLHVSRVDSPNLQGILISAESYQAIMWCSVIYALACLILYSISFHAIRINNLGVPAIIFGCIGFFITLGILGVSLSEVMSTAQIKTGYAYIEETIIAVGAGIASLSKTLADKLFVNPTPAQQKMIADTIGNTDDPQIAADNNQMAIQSDIVSAQAIQMTPISVNVMPNTEKITALNEQISALSVDNTNLSAQITELRTSLESAKEIGDKAIKSLEASDEMGEQMVITANKLAANRYKINKLTRLLDEMEVKSRVRTILPPPNKADIAKYYNILMSNFTQTFVQAHSDYAGNVISGFNPKIAINVAEEHFSTHNVSLGSLNELIVKFVSNGVFSPVTSNGDFFYPAMYEKTDIQEMPVSIDWRDPFERVVDTITQDGIIGNFVSASKLLLARAGSKEFCESVEDVYGEQVTYLSSRLTGIHLDILYDMSSYYSARLVEICENAQNNTLSDSFLAEIMILVNSNSSAKRIFMGSGFLNGL